MSKSLGVRWLEAVSRIELDPSIIRAADLDKVAAVLGRSGLQIIDQTEEKIVMVRGQASPQAPIDLGSLTSPYAYARPEVCLEGGSYVVRNLVTRDPFIDFVREHPQIGHYDNIQSYKVPWSVVGNVAVASGVPIYARPSQGRQQHYDLYEPGQNLSSKSKGIEVSSFAELCAGIDNLATLAEQMPTYPRSALNCAFNFINVVALDQAADRV